MTRLVTAQLGPNTTDTDCADCPHLKAPDHCASWCDVFDDGCGERSQACIDNEEALATIRSAARAYYSGMYTSAALQGMSEGAATYRDIMKRLGL